MTNIEYYNNIILKIYHDNEFNQLILLKARIDCSLYIAVIDLNNNFTATFDIKDVFLSYNIYYSGALSNTDDAERRNAASRACKKLISSYDRNFTLIHEIYAFDVDLAGSQILVDAKCIKYNVDEFGVRSENKQEKYRIIIKINGDIRFIKPYTKWEYLGDDNDTTFLKFLDPETVITCGNEPGASEKLVLWDLVNDKYYEKKLIQWEHKTDDDSIYYDYIGSFALLKSERMLGLVFENPTYGQDCLKISKIGADYSLTVIFKYVFQDVRLVFMAFRQASNEFAILEYTDADDKSSANVNIRIYGIDDTHIPRKIITTELNHRLIFIREITFYSAEVLVIVTTDKLFLYNIINGKEIDVLPKDAKRAYYISVGKIYYILNDALCIHTNENRQVYHLEKRKDSYTKPPVSTAYSDKKSPSWPPGMPLSKKIMGILRLILIIVILVALLRGCWIAMNPQTSN